MRINMVGAFVRNAPHGTEIAFAKGLERLGGHTLNLVDPSIPGPMREFDRDADATMFFNWTDNDNCWNSLAAQGGKKILYQTDDVQFPDVRKMTEHVSKFCDYALSFDDLSVSLMRKMGYKRAEKLNLTADPLLYQKLDLERDIDFCFIGNMSNYRNHASRRKMVSILQDEGFSLAIADALYDIQKIVEIYNRSRVVLHHAADVGQPFGHGYGYQCRHFEAGFTGACVLSNKIHNSDDLLYVEQFNDEKSLVDIAHKLIENDEFRRDSSALTYENLMERHTPEQRAKELVDFIESL